MKSILFLLLIMQCMGINLVIAQGTMPVAYLKYRVVFENKAGTPFNTGQPEMFLSKKAIERRTKQNIQVLENDLPVNPAYVEAVASLGVKVLNRSRWMNAITVQLPDSALIAKIQALGFVKSTAKIAKTKAKSKADDLMEGLIRMFEKAQAEQQQKKKGGDSYYGNSHRQIEMLKGDQLHRQGFKGQGMTIAVLDAGFSRVDQINFFDSLRLSGRLLGTRDFVAGGDSVFEDNSHGTSVLSTMAGYIPGTYVGTAPLAQYWLLRTEDADSEYPIEEDNWVTGAEFADSVGADVINSSLGYTRFDDTTMSYRYVDLNGNTAWITRGADIAASKGMLIVNSAGNSGADKWNYVGVPADGDSVLAIGSVNSSEVYSPFSSKGPTADGRIKPNVSAMGQDIPVVTESGAIAPLNGTSFSSPVMAGMVACLWQAHPEASSMQVFKAIEQSADQYEQPDELKGFGVPDMLIAHSILARNSNITVPSDSIVNLFPNPFIEGITVEFYSTIDQTLEVSILTSGGKRIAKESFLVYARVNNLLQLENVRKLKQGNYVVGIKTGNKSFSRKIIKN